MRNIRRNSVLLATLGALLVGGTFGAIGLANAENETKATGAKPKHTLKQVMVKAHKDGLLKKILTGKAKPEEKSALLDFYVSMYESKPKKGKIEAWRMKASESVVAAAKVVLEHKGAEAELKKATSCAGCHKVFK